MFRTLISSLLYVVCVLAIACDADTSSSVRNNAATATPLVSTSVEQPGVNCKSGGHLLVVGTDKNRDGELDDSEVQKRSYLCNGESGLIGESGKTALVVVSDDAGLNCPVKGSKILSGLDKNSDGSLGSDEVLKTAYVCDGQSGLETLVKVSEEKADGNCAAGGRKIESGTDTNRNGSLDDVEVESTDYVCNGTKGDKGDDGPRGFGAGLLIEKEDAGDNCTYGGSKVTVWTDKNNDRKIDTDKQDPAKDESASVTERFICKGDPGDTGKQGDKGDDGPRGIGAGIKIESEDPGISCYYGGTKIVAWTDKNNNGQVDTDQQDPTKDESATVTEQFTCNDGTCGDGEIEGLEECDDGEANHETAPCSTSCKKQCPTVAKAIYYVSPTTGACYLRIASSKTWNAAADACSVIGGHLLHMSNADEITELKASNPQILIASGLNAWVGATDQDSPGPGEGTIRWTTGDKNGPFVLGYTSDAVIKSFEDNITVRDCGLWSIGPQAVAGGPCDAKLGEYICEVKIPTP